MRVGCGSKNMNGGMGWVVFAEWCDGCVCMDGAARACFFYDKSTMVERWSTCIESRCERNATLTIRTRGSTIVTCVPIAYLASRVAVFRHNDRRNANWVRESNSDLHHAHSTNDFRRYAWLYHAMSTHALSSREQNQIKPTCAHDTSTTCVLEQRLIVVVLRVVRVFPANRPDRTHQPCARVLDRRRGLPARFALVQLVEEFHRSDLPPAALPEQQEPLGDRELVEVVVLAQLASPVMQNLVHRLLDAPKVPPLSARFAGNGAFWKAARWGKSVPSQHVVVPLAD